MSEWRARETEYDVSSSSSLSLSETGEDETISYFEIKVECGGMYDQIAVGITANPNYSQSEFAGYSP
jgi:hypothetical protein